MATEIRKPTPILTPKKYYCPLTKKINEELNDHYARIEFLEKASAAIQDHLYSHPDPDGSACDTEDVDYENSGSNEHYYEDSNHTDLDADVEYDQHYQEEHVDGEEDGYDDNEDWDGNDEYYQ